jgi:hypothetical protein
MATSAGIGVFQTELGANQVPLKLAPPLVLVLTATVMLLLAGEVPLAPLQVRVYVVVALSAPVLVVPVVGSFPDQPPEAVQLVAFVDDQLSTEEAPLLTLLGLADRLTVGLATVAPVTSIENAGSEAEPTPSLTPITIFGSVPTSPLAGVPLS